MWRVCKSAKIKHPGGSGGFVLWAQACYQFFSFLFTFVKSHLWLVDGPFMTKLKPLINQFIICQHYSSIMNNTNSSVLRNFTNIITRSERKNNSACQAVVAKRSSALDSSSGVARMWVRIPAWPVAALVSWSKTLNHNGFVLRMGRKAVGPMCCVMHVKEPRTLIVKEKGLASVFLDSRLEHPAGWICARYKSYHYYYYYYYY